MLCVFSTTFTSCTHTSETDSNNYFSRQDSVEIAKIVKAQMPGEFTKVEDFKDYVQSKAQDAYDDSVALNLPSEILNNVATVVQRQHGKFTLHDIILEYKMNQKVYDNLPKKKDPQPDNTEPKKVTAVKDTIINGEHVKLFIEEDTYEQ
jgi:hypothetical protein